MKQSSDMDLETILMDILDNETAIGSSKKELLGTCETDSATMQETQVPRKDIANAISLTETAELLDKTATEVDTTRVCKINSGSTMYYDIRAKEVIPVDSIPAWKIAADLNKPACETAASLNQPACEIAVAPNDPACETAVPSKSVCKTTDLINMYFSDEDNSLEKINIMKLHKEETGYPRDGKRRNILRRWITERTDEAIKAGACREVCSLCQYTSSCKQMHVHFRKHYTKHFCSCGYQSASSDSIYCHQKGRTCFARDIYEVHKNSYPRFLRHVGWKEIPKFGECIPTLNPEGKRTITHRRPAEVPTRRSVKERLGKPVNTARVYASETHPELERLEAEARWHKREAERYRECARR